MVIGCHCCVFLIKYLRCERAAWCAGLLVLGCSRRNPVRAWSVIV